MATVRCPVGVGRVRVGNMYYNVQRRPKKSGGVINISEVDAKRLLQCAGYELVAEESKSVEPEIVPELTLSFPVTTSTATTSVKVNYDFAPQSLCLMCRAMNFIKSRFSKNSSTSRIPTA